MLVDTFCGLLRNQAGALRWTWGGFLPSRERDGAGNLVRDVDEQLLNRLVGALYTGQDIVNMGSQASQGFGCCSL